MVRNRTELVTNNVESDNDNSEEVEDSGDDWRPAPKAGGRGSNRGSPKTGGKRKVAAGKKSVAKKRREETESEDEDEEEEEEDDDDFDDDDEDEESSDKRKSGKRGRAATVNRPDRDGNMELFLFKNDLNKEFKTDAKLCMWRRDGASLLQKYIVEKAEAGAKDLIFKGSSVYSCWEEKRRNDFFQIKVQLVGDKKDQRVKVLDMDELQKFANEDRPKIDLTPKGAGREADGDNDEEEEAEDEEEEDLDEDVDEE